MATADEKSDATTVDAAAAAPVERQETTVSKLPPLDIRSFETKDYDAVRQLVADSISLLKIQI